MYKAIGGAKLTFNELSEVNLDVEVQLPILTPSSFLFQLSFVIIKSDDKNNGNWPLAVMREVFPGRGGVVRGVKLETAKVNLERPKQHLCPLELPCNKGPTTKITELSPDAELFRPKRVAAVEAAERIKAMAYQDD